MLSDRVLNIMRKHEIPITPGMTDPQAWNAIYALQKKSSKPRSTTNICFTGFVRSEAEDLKSTAASRGWGVNSDVVKSTTHLCCGDNAGAKKVAKAKDQGVRIISLREFEHMMETGEVL